MTDQIWFQIFGILSLLVNGYFATKQKQIAARLVETNEKLSAAYREIEKLEAILNRRNIVLPVTIERRIQTGE